MPRRQPRLGKQLGPGVRGIPTDSPLPRCPYSQRGYGNPRLNSYSECRHKAPVLLGVRTYSLQLPYMGEAGKGCGGGSTVKRTRIIFPSDPSIFLGHYSLRFPWKYDEPDGRCLCGYDISDGNSSAAPLLGQPFTPDRAVGLSIPQMFYVALGPSGTRLPKSNRVRIYPD